MKWATHVDVHIDYPALDRVKREATESTSRRAAEKTRDRARKYAPKRTGALARSIVFRRTRQTNDITEYQVGSPLKYAEYQERGTGPIIARPGGLLRFTSPTSGLPVYARRTRGVPAKHFLQKAAREIKLSDFLR